MSFLLDVADPSIHFHARQGCSASKLTTDPAGSGSVSTAAAKAHKIIPTTITTPPKAATAHTTAPATSSLSNNNHHSNLQHGLLLPTTNMLSAMSRMIRTASSGSTLTLPLGPGSATHSPVSSRPGTPEAIHVSDPFAARSMTTTNSTSRTSTSRQEPRSTSPCNYPKESKTTPAMGPLRTRLSPWMMPSVCDDDQMNKLVSFQL